MPRVNTVKKSRKDQGACGKCGKALPKGSAYKFWKFRYGGKRIRCLDCKVSRGELTQSKLGPIYDAQDEAGEAVGSWTSDEGLDALASITESLSETVREAADEYTEAAEHFGGQGENQERADELGSWADELECVDLDEFDSDAAREEASEEVKDSDEADLDEGKTLPDDYEPDSDEVERILSDKCEEWAEEQRDKAQGVVDECPL